MIQDLSGLIVDMTKIEIGQGRDKFLEIYDRAIKFNEDKVLKVRFYEIDDINAHARLNELSDNKFIYICLECGKYRDKNLVLIDRLSFNYEKTAYILDLFEQSDYGSISHSFKHSFLNAV